MKFEGYTYETGITDEPLIVGEFDESGAVLRIEGVDESIQKLVASRKRTHGLDNIISIQKAFPGTVIFTEDDDGFQDYEGGADDTMKIVKYVPDKKQVFGWAYVSHDEHGDVVVDHSGEFIEDPTVLEDAAYEYVLKSRKGGVEHKRDEDDVIQHSTMIESIVFTPEKIAKMGIPEGTIPQGAWWVGFQITSDDVWDDIKNNKRSFSIHGSGLKREVQE